MKVLVVRLPNSWILGTASRQAWRKFWKKRYQSLMFEWHLMDNGTKVVKFFLHISKKSRETVPSTPGGTGRLEVFLKGSFRARILG
jgi:hypothetical protein